MSPRCRDGLNPGSSRCRLVAKVSHGLTWCQPGVSRMCHGVAPVWCQFITVLPGMTTSTVLLDFAKVHPGVFSVGPGLLGLHSVLIYVSH